ACCIGTLAQRRIEESNSRPLT
ncbi:hypothetical protein D039_4315B, partial [Vibrio parahaemolyticus EKP-028]